MKPEDLPDAYPLKWPDGVPRTPSQKRARAKFAQRVSGPAPSRLTVSQALSRALGEIGRLGAQWPVVSSNVHLRQDGLPYSTSREPEDPGVAVYFYLKGKSHCLPCDRWDRVADNIAAIAKHIEALRGQARWGVGSIEQAFAGYRAALPAPGSDWRTVLGIKAHPSSNISDDERSALAVKVRERWRELAAEIHPDRGGDPNEAIRLNQAKDAALRELGKAHQ